MVIDDAGLWCQIDTTVPEGSPALFLDRDGVIVVDTDYLGRAEDLRMVEGAASAIARCNALHIPVIVVTNQSGIARGYYDWNGFRAVQDALRAALKVAGGHLDGVLACAYHGDGRDPLRVAGHPWRKPNPGMILEAGRRLRLDLSRSWIVGDRLDDLAAGKAAGLAGGTLLSDNPNQAASLASAQFVMETAPDLADAVSGLLERRRLTGRER